MESVVWNRQASTWVFAVVIAAALALSGCDNQEEDVATAATPAAPASTPAQTPTPTPEQAKNDLSISSDQQDAEPTPSEKAAPTPEASDSHQPSIPPEQQLPDISQYTADEPRLFGVTLKDGKQSVQRLLGEPTGKFVMDDAAGPLTVYQYDGAMIGFNQQDFVEFVTVSSGAVDPGLNGIRVGSTSEDVKNALGQPEQDSDYVLSYRSKGTVLKLDVDPNTSLILSIKLFKEE